MHRFDGIGNTRKSTKSLDISHDWLWDKHQQIAGIATFQIPRSLQDCANLPVVGGSKKRLIGFTLRKSGAPRSKQDAALLGITSNKTYLN
jgi:hypothetical protein